MNFNHLNVAPHILRALQEEGYTEATPIQEKAIPHILTGGDLLGCAQTGTGKTAAFAVPTLQLLDSAEKPSDGKKIRTLVITPTRELALQIYESFCVYGRYTKLRSCVVFGGVAQKPQEIELKRGVDILVATPGRLNDLIGQGIISLSNVEIFILDEADRMLDMGFLNDVKKIIAKLPSKRQTLMFSATMPPNIAKMAGAILHNPETVTVTPVSSTVEIIEQRLYYVDKRNKKDLLVHVLSDPRIKSALVFTRTKHGADRIARALTQAKIAAQAIHGDKSQGNRQLALSSFKEGKLRVLVATDIAARGIDIDGLAYVVNYELPNVPETYVHRIGRTGRAGLDGVAISFCDFDEKPLLKDIEKLTQKKLAEVAKHPYPLQDNFPAIKVVRPPRPPRDAQEQPRGARPPRDPQAKAKGATPPRDPQAKAKGATPSRFSQGQSKGTPPSRSSRAAHTQTKGKTSQRPARRTQKG